MIWMMLSNDIPGPDNLAIYYEPLDGNLDKVTLVNRTIDIGFKEIMSVQQFQSGRWVVTDNLPTRVRPKFSHGAPRKGQLTLPDYIKTRMAQIVSTNLRKLIDAHDPGKHQFVPVTLEWSSGDKIDTPYFWFFPGIRLFALDKERTQPPLRQPTGFFDIRADPNDWNMVFRADVVGTNALFCTAEMSGYIFCTDQLKSQIEATGMRGLRFDGPYDLI